MRYYKVDTEVQSAYLPKLRRHHTFVKDELYTRIELERMGVNYAWSNLCPVDVSRKKTYRFFGARFAS